VNVANAKGLAFTIWDPTGNITALVEDEVAVEWQPEVAAQIMRKHPEVEQVGFLHMGDHDADAELRMAGGEFCGNASISAAALYLLRSGVACDDTQEVLLKVSGTQGLIHVLMHSDGDGSNDARILMPRELEIEGRRFSFDGLNGALSLVRMEGISHIVIEPESVFFGLLDERCSAERAVRAWCEELSADGLGLMFLEGQGSERRLTPLVYVPKSETVFWENSCASGSSAVGMCLAARIGATIKVSLDEPGGTLCVTSNPATGQTWLEGHVSFRQSATL
jgi:diaminopimelate epimerase